MGCQVAYLKDMGGTLPPLTTHRPMRAFAAYLVFTAAALATASYLVEGAAAGLTDRMEQRNAAIEALR